MRATRLGLLVASGIMVIEAIKFTPEVLLSAPRRSAGVPNSDASQILYSVSTYDFESHEKINEVRLLRAESKESVLVTNKKGAGELNWLGDEDVLLLATGENGATDVLIGKPNDFENTNYVAGTIDGSPSGVIVKPLGNGSYIFAFGAPSTPNGELFNGDKEPKKNTTGRLYSSLFVRHWDTYLSSNRNNIWYGVLARNRNSMNSTKYALGDLTNALAHTQLVSPIEFATGSDWNFDISTTGLAFVAKDPSLNVATNTKQNLYIAKRTNSSSGYNLERPVRIAFSTFNGATSNPMYSPNGKSLAFFSMRQNGYEADKNQILLMPDVANPSGISVYFANEGLSGRWDRSPNTMQWAADGSALLVLALNLGRNVLYSLPMNPYNSSSLPMKVLQEGSLSDVKPLKSGEVFVSGSSFIDSSVFLTIGGDLLKSPNEPTIISSVTKGGSLFGLSRDQIDEFYTEGADAKVHSWIIKPSNFNPSKKYPLAFLIHGGPQGAWNDGWSTRWNLMMFAEQGYVVVAPNPTGSTGFGQELTDKIQEEWGGLPYLDLKRVHQHVQKNFSFVDMDRAVALGASYGGYMANWIQGHSLGRKFKALVTHDGVFSMTGQLASEELFFPNHEFSGPHWEHRETWLEWDPSRFTEYWATPHLIIHSEKDYRLTISEGLSAFNVLQSKGIKSKFLTFPDENHWVLNPENSLVWHATVLDFINPEAGLPKYGNQGHAAELMKQADMDSGWPHVGGGLNEPKPIQELTAQVVMAPSPPPKE